MNCTLARRDRTTSDEMIPAIDTKSEILTKDYLMLGYCHFEVEKIGDLIVVRLAHTLFSMN